MDNTSLKPRPARPARVVAALAALLLSACATTPLPRDYETRVPERASLPPPPMIYPARGQTERQLQRDRYECYRWAVEQSGFDPARVRAMAAPPPPPQVILDPPAGVGTATGAITGAVIGAAMSSRHHSAEGAAVGAVLGGIVGAASDSAREAEARRIEQALGDRQAARGTRLDSRSSDYVRAFSACLEGRGYTVR